MPDAIDSVRKRLLALSQDRGVSLAGLSILLGRNPSYLQQFVRKGSPRRLAEQDRYRLAEFFGIDEGKLREDRDQAFAPSLPQSDAADWASIQRLDIGASAGHGRIGDDEAAFDTLRFSQRWLTEQGLESAQLSAIRVEGDSMEPMLNHGDEILVDRTPRAFREGVYVVRLNGTLMVKRVASGGAGQFTLLSQNLAYPPIAAHAGELEIVGRVVWKGGRL